MAALVVNGGWSLPPGWSPARFVLANGNQSNGGGSWSNLDGRQPRVVMGIDVTSTGVQQASPSFCDIYAEGTIFYHDSQSVGEGGGITFAWRGMFLWVPNETLTVSMSNPSPIQWGVMIWGIVQGEQTSPPR